MNRTQIGNRQLEIGNDWGKHYAYGDIVAPDLAFSFVSKLNSDYRSA